MSAAVPEHQSQNCRHYDQRCDRVFEDLLRPKPSVRLLCGFLGHGDAVPSEQVNVPNDQQDDPRRQGAGVECEEARERMMAVLGSSDHQLLHRWPDDRGHRGDTGRHLCRPVAFLVPGKKVSGQ